MKQLLQRISQNKPARRGRVTAPGGTEWMKRQLLRMTELNQGLVQMSGGK